MASNSIGKHQRRAKANASLSVFLDAETAAILNEAAHNMDRTLSWLVRQAVKRAVPTITAQYTAAAEAINVK